MAYVIDSMHDNTTMGQPHLVMVVVRRRNHMSEELLQSVNRVSQMKRREVRGAKFDLAGIYSPGPRRLLFAAIQAVQLDDLHSSRFSSIGHFAATLRIFFRYCKISSVVNPPNQVAKRFSP